MPRKFSNLKYLLCGVALLGIVEGNPPLTKDASRVDETRESAKLRLSSVSEGFVFLLKPVQIERNSEEILNLSVHDDLNQDGYSDIILRESDSERKGVSYKFGNKGGNYTAGGHCSSNYPLHSKWDFATGDLNNDGYPEIVMMDLGTDSKGIEIFVNNRQGNFSYDGFLWQNKNDSDLMSLNVKDYDGVAGNDVLIKIRNKQFNETRVLENMLGKDQ